MKRRVAMNTGSGIRTDRLQGLSQASQVLENMAEREGFEPSVQVLARTTV